MKDSGIDERGIGDKGIKDRAIEERGFKDIGMKERGIEDRGMEAGGLEMGYDLIVIGSGPGGYVAAIKAAKLGMKTAIIEGREIGGTCLNRGCIPTKTLLHSAHLYYEALGLKEAGISYSGLNFDYGRIMEHKEGVVSKIREGIKGLLKANGVTVIQGFAKIAAGRRVIVKPTASSGQSFSGNETILSADKILIAAGSKPVIPRIEGADLKNVITSDELLSQGGKLYKRLLIIGGGVIGVEFATIYRELGCEVEIIEAMDRILPNMDKELSQSISMSLKKKGVVIHTGAKVTKVAEKIENNRLINESDINIDDTAASAFVNEAKALICEYEEKATVKTTEAEGILLSVGRRADTSELFSEGVNPELEGACIKVNDSFETSIKGIYAIGDVIKGKQLAHVASAQGITAVELMCGKQPSINLAVIPSCIYTSPEAAAVGLTEEEAIQAGYLVKTGKYPMLGNSKTILSMGERGYIKIICDAATDKILGAQLLCDRATDMVGELATAIVNGLTSGDLASVIRPHPTYSEAITEAAENVNGMAIHIMPGRR